MHEDTDLALVLRSARLPLRVRQAAREGGKRAGPLLETVGEGIGPRGDRR